MSIKRGISYLPVVWILDSSCGGALEQAALGGPDRDLGSGAKSQLAQDVNDVAGRGALSDDQRFPDLTVGQPTRDQRRDLQLASREASCRRPLRLAVQRRLQSASRGPFF